MIKEKRKMRQLKFPPYEYIKSLPTVDEDDDDCHYFSNMQLLNQEALDKCISITENWGTYNIQTFSLEEFLELKEGDIIKLDNKVKDDLVVKINNEKKFFARPGIRKNKVCVKIADIYDAQTDFLKDYM